MPKKTHIYTVQSPKSSKVKPKKPRKLSKVQQSKRYELSFWRRVRVGMLNTPHLLAGRKAHVETVRARKRVKKKRRMSESARLRQYKAELRQSLELAAQAYDDTLLPPHLRHR